MAGGGSPVLGCVHVRWIMKVLVVTATRASSAGWRRTCGRCSHGYGKAGVRCRSRSRTRPVTARQTILDHCPDVPQEIVSDAQSVVEVANRVRPDVVFSHDLPDPSADDALARRYPVVRYAHNYDGLCVSGTKCHTAGGWQTCSRPLGLGCLVAYSRRGAAGGTRSPRGDCI